MVDWYDGFRDMHDQGAHRHPAVRISDALLSPDVPSERMEMLPGSETQGGTTLFRFHAIWLTVPIALWFFGYASGLFPYLGAYAYNHGNGEVTYSLQTPSPRIMLLFKGQVAFIDYTAESGVGANNKIYLDVKPWPGLGHSKNRQILLGTSKGRFEVPITQTDFYQFSFSAGSEASRSDFYYSVSWGAR